jgi:hypothetical protein
MKVPNVTNYNRILVMLDTPHHLYRCVHLLLLFQYNRRIATQLDTRYHDIISNHFYIYTKIMPHISGIHSINLICLPFGKYNMILWKIHCVWCSKQEIQFLLRCSCEKLVNIVGGFLNAQNIQF